MTGELEPNREGLYEFYMEDNRNVVLRMRGKEDIEFLWDGCTHYAVLNLAAIQLHKVLRADSEPEVWLFNNATDTENLVMSCKKFDELNYEITLDDQTRIILEWETEWQFSVELFRD